MGTRKTTSRTVGSDFLLRGVLPCKLDKLKGRGRAPKPIENPVNNLREARLEAGLTQAEVGEALGVSQATISLVERGGNKRIDRDKWFLLSDILDRDIKWLYGWHNVNNVDNIDKIGNINASHSTAQSDQPN